jgi:hypothetical protein
VAIRIPHRISGGARFSFRGSGRARFRLQHTGTRDGGPDHFAWCEVSAMSNAKFANPREAIDPRDGVSVLGGVLLDVVDGNLEVIYRQHSASWLRVLPLDCELDSENLEACMKYEIAIEPLT